MIRLTTKQLSLCVAILAYRSSLGGNIDHVAEMSDTYKKQEPYAAQSDTVMFAPSHPEPKQSEKPRRRTFEDIRTENRKNRVHTSQDSLHLPHDGSTGNRCGQ